MKISSNNSFDINVLKGALVTDPNGAEFYVNGVSVDIANHEICIHLLHIGKGAEASTVEWSTVKDWEIQFQGGT
tara:strand:+ start:163 stop:384 length:222 start_codon:yes stop_codon:yes gene_type:complete